MMLGIFIFLAGAFIMSVSGYKVIALQRGWPIGAFYHKYDLTYHLVLPCLAMICARLFFAFTSDGDGLFLLLCLIGGGTLGTGFMYVFLKSKIGPTALIGAPIFTILIFISSTELVPW
jgi:hypothetical protein